MEITRFVDDVNSGKIINKKDGADRYLKYVYDDKNFPDDRNITETTKDKKGKDKVKKKTSNTYIIKKIFDDFVYTVFGVLDPKPESKKLDIATGGEDMPPLETEEEAKSSKLEKEVKTEIDKIMKRIKEKSSSESDKEEPRKDEDEGEGLKLMTPNPLLTRLPILLAQKKQEIIVKN